MVMGRDRVRAAYKRQMADCVPTYLIIGPFNAKLSGFTIKEFLTEPDKFAQAQINFHQLFKPDVIPALADLNIEVEALGAKVKFPENSMCIVEEPLLKEKTKLLDLKVPDPKSTGRMPYYLEACRTLCEAIEDAVIGGIVSGPWVIAIALREPEQLLRDCTRDPAFVHSLMEFTTEVVKVYGIEVIKTGAGMSLGEPSASCSLISPKIYREFIAPYHKELVAFFGQRKVGVTIHVCGYIDPIMEDIIASGFTTLSIDAPSSLKKLVEISNKRVVIIGNVPTSLFMKTEREPMEEAVKECLNIAADKGGAFILSSGCEVPPIAPVESVRNFMEAARKYGKASHL